MNKVDLFKGHMIVDRMEDHIFDYWHEWRMKEAGLTYKDSESQEYHDVLYSMPEQFVWNINYRDSNVRIRWCDGETIIPLTWFYDDEKDQPDLELMWHQNYYDGPLSGVAKLNGQFIWMELMEEDEETGDRLFGLYSILPEHKAEVFRRHKLFQECVGYHCDHDPEVYKPFGETDNSRSEEFYKMKFKELGLQQNDRFIMEAHWFQFRNWIRSR